MRTVSSFNADWLFNLGKDLKGSEVVHLPHCVTITPANSSGGINYQGPCVYQKSFALDKSLADKKIIVEFEGAMGVTVLTVNGNAYPAHTCSYTPLVADITDHVKFGEENIISLCLDNSDNEDVPPGKPQGMLDFSYEGGLYRDARLIVTDKLHITHELLTKKVAGGGVFVHTTEVSEKSAKVNVLVDIKNEGGAKRKFALELSLLDAKKAVVASATVKGELEMDCDTVLKTTLDVTTPSLWSPETPYIYSLVAKIVEEGNITDEVKTDIGIRDFKFTHEDGLVFNGKAIRISGANYHQTYPYIGNAVPNSLLRMDAKLLRETGMKNIRSHYPLASAFTDACNRLGITLIISAPGWQHYKDGIFAERCNENIRNMVRWLRNNPSILMWEPILNETQCPEDFQQKCHDAVHEEYPFSPCFTASDHGPTDVAYRAYDPGMLEPGMAYGSRKGENGKIYSPPLWVREYGDAPDDWVNQNCSWRVPRRMGDAAMLCSVDRLLGKDSQSQINNYIDMVSDATLCGYGIWPGIEHNRGYHINPCMGGFFDLFRVDKFVQHFMKSQQPIEEAGVELFIATFWLETSPNDVTIFSNAQKVRLYHNDDLVEERAPENIAVTHPPFVFEKVRTRFHKRERSTLRAEAIVDGKVVCVKTITSPGVPQKLSLRLAQEVSLVADGADIALIYCDVLDAEGNFVPMTADSHPIKFTVTGEGTIIGDASTGANPICPEAGIAPLMIKATTKAGKINIKAEPFWGQSNKRCCINLDEIVIQSVNK